MADAPSGPRRWNLGDLVDLLSEDLANHSGVMGRWASGRIVGLLASPATASSTGMAVGISGLPAGVSTPTHAHDAEELAIVMSGTGTIEIAKEPVAVGPGDVVITPSQAPHRTSASPGTPLLVLWVYAPPGSELRWLADDPDEQPSR
jgi:mannose-6-phosphate isomerase-like protein (cupin superfamily)